MVKHNMCAKETTRHSNVRLTVETFFCMQKKMRKKKYKKWLSRVRIRDFSFDLNFSLFSCKQDDNEEDWHERKIRCSAEEKSLAFFEGREWRKRTTRTTTTIFLDGVIIKWFIILQTINHMKRAKGLLKSLKERKHSSLSASMQAEREEEKAKKKNVEKWWWLGSSSKLSENVHIFLRRRAEKPEKFAKMTTFESFYFREFSRQKRSFDRNLKEQKPAKPEKAH